MVDIAVITCPRALPTLNTSLHSLRDAGFKGPIHVFAEPGQYLIDVPHIHMIIHGDKRGAFSNYDFALRWLLENKKNPLVCVLEDDYIYTDRLLPLIEDISTKKHFGYYNLFTNRLQPGVDKLEKGWNRIKLGWNSWGVGYVFERDTVPKIMAHEVYQKTLKERNKNIDAAVSEACLKLELPMFYHRPSACYSIGYLSTLGHSTWKDGLGL